MKQSTRWLAVLLVILLPMTVMAATGTITGKVVDDKTGSPLPGANVVVKGTTFGAAADVTGTYTIKNVPAGDATLQVTFIGYDTESVEIAVLPNQSVTENFDLTPRAISAATITVLADRAKERETPVAFSDIEKNEMEARLGSRDIPLVLNTTPSVYSTQQGGGAGDARINVRGFNQRNVAIMINGIPVNDMENGWVYWSNWDGLGDATSSIQVQRGLSAVNLATPSIGGTMNVITDPTAQDAGVSYKQEIGNAGFLKSTLFGHTGVIDGKYAASAGVVRKVGDGLIDATWTDAWAYYFGGSYNIDKNNRLEVYLMGAPQRHGQNLYKQNIGAYSHDFAGDLDTYDPAAFGDFLEQGQTFNQNWSPVRSSYGGQQAFNFKQIDRYDEGFLNERENFYHKPLANINWYSQLSEKLNLYSTVYYSGGTGGGTGTYGDVYRTDASGVLGDDDHRFYFGPSPWLWDWNATLDMNSGPAGTYAVDQDELNKRDRQSLGILRNSRNNQWTIGAISKAYYKVNENLTTSVGLDWRTAEIEHFREVRDLLGGAYYIKTADEYEPNRQIGLGDKMAYNFTNTVDWFGAHAQAEYSKGRLTAYGMGGWSTIKYTYTNHFRMQENSMDNLYSETEWIDGFQIKGGLNYRVTTAFNAFANVGYVSKVPIFDAVISDRDGTKAEDPQNEKFTSFELGAQYVGMEGRLNIKGNLYYTTWTDRTNNLGVVNRDGSEGFIFVQGMDQLHQGVEFEAAFQPMNLFRIDAAASYGMWEYLDNVQGTYKDYAGGAETEETYNYYVEGLKVGDAPQTQFAFGATVFPIDGLSAQIVGKYYDRHFSDWDPFDRTEAGTVIDAWQSPSYFLLDLHAGYDLPLNLAGFNVKVFAHVFNALDEMYIQDSVDNSQYNAFDNDHDADDAEVFFGLPRMFNVGLQINY